MHPLLLLGQLKWRHLANFLRVQGSSWQTLMRAVGVFLMFAFLRFVTYNILETFRAASSPAEVIFIASMTLMAAGLMLFLFDLLVFVADEFQVGTDANDFEFLLSLPVGFSTIVWAKVLLRAIFDLVGVSLMLPMLVALAMYFDLPLYAWPLLYLVYFAIEVAAGLASVIVFFLLAQVFSMTHLEALRLLVGFAMPFVAGAFVTAKGELLDPARLTALHQRWGELVGWMPVTWLVGGLAPASQGGSWLLMLEGLLSVVVAAGAMHWLLRRMQLLATSLAPDLNAGDVDPIWSRLFGAARGTWRALAVKDIAMLVRRRVSFITVALMPVGIVMVNMLTVAAGAGHRGGTSPEILTVTTMMVPLLFLPYMMAAQSLGQIEYSRIPFLQSLPISTERVLRAKALFWTPIVFLLCEAVHLTFLVSYGRWQGALFLENSFWIAMASALVTHLAVSAAAMFPVSENALFKQQGATLTVSSLFYLTGSLGAIALVFPLTFQNRAILLFVTALLANYVIKKAARRIEYFDENTLVSTEPGLWFDEAFIVFDAYICLYLMTNAGIALLTGIQPATQFFLSTGALLASQLALAQVTRGYLELKGYSLGAAWWGRWTTFQSVLPSATVGAFLALTIWLVYRAEPPKELHVLLDPSSGPLALLFLFTAVISGPLCEEIFFRGLLLRSYVATSGMPMVGLLVSSALFAVPHYFLAGHFYPSLMLGLVAGVAMLLGGGLQSAVATHVGFNAVSLSLALPTISGVVTAVAMAAGALVWMLARPRTFTSTASPGYSGGHEKPVQS